MDAAMSVQDELWLTMDRSNNLMVVDGAMMLRGPARLEAVKGVYAELVQRFPVFARRAVKHGRGWAWQDDPAFALDAHVTEVALPEPVTFTIGLACAPEAGTEAAELLRAADAALYVAKARGGHCVEVAGGKRSGALPAVSSPQA